MATDTGGEGSTQALFGIVQGGMDRELRRESALRTVEIGFPGYAIGGLSVGEPREMTREIVLVDAGASADGQAAVFDGGGDSGGDCAVCAMGVDMMDCVLPTRAARHGLLFTSEGKVSIKQARYAQDEGRLIRRASAACASAIRGRICGIFMRRRNCWRRC